MIDRYLLAIDWISAIVGKAFAWSILVLTGAIVYEVASRYLFGSPTEWAFDASYILYGVLFMMAGGYTLSRNGHVRGDFLYRKFPPRRQAWFDLILYVLFFFPGMLAFVNAGWQFFYLSYIINEHSAFSPAGPIIWPFKGMIPLVGCLMILQGIAEAVRCVICIQTGAWPRRLHDVEETEAIILAQAQAQESKGAQP